MNFTERYRLVNNLNSIKSLPFLLTPTNLDEQKMIFLDCYPKLVAPHFTYDDNRIQKAIPLINNEIAYLIQYCDELERELDHPYAELVFGLIERAVHTLQASVIVLNMALHSETLDEHAQFYLDRIYGTPTEADIDFAAEFVLADEKDVPQLFREHLIPAENPADYSSKKLEQFIKRYLQAQQQHISKEEARRLAAIIPSVNTKIRLWRKLISDTLAVSGLANAKAKINLDRYNAFGGSTYSYIQDADFKQYEFRMMRDLCDSALNFIRVTEHEMTHFRDHVAEDDLFLEIFGLNRSVRPTKLPFVVPRRITMFQPNANYEGHAIFSELRTGSLSCYASAEDILISNTARSGNNFTQTIEYVIELIKPSVPNFSKASVWQSVAKAFYGRRNTAVRTNYTFTTESHEYFTSFVRLAREYCRKDARTPKQLDDLFRFSALTLPQLKLLEKLMFEKNAPEIPDRFKNAPSPVEFLKNTFLKT